LLKQVTSVVAQNNRALQRLVEEYKTSLDEISKLF